MYDTYNVAFLKYTRSYKTHYVLLVLLPPQVKKWHCNMIDK